MEHQGDTRRLLTQVFLQRVPEAYDLIPVALVYSARDLVEDCGVSYLFIFRQQECFAEDYCQGAVAFEG
jgi:hypothetical protein